MVQEEQSARHREEVTVLLGSPMEGYDMIITAAGVCRRNQDCV